MNAPVAAATMRVLLFIGEEVAVDPLHCTTVPFSLDVAVNVRVEVISARVVVITTVGLAVAVSVAMKSMLSHCGGETLLQSSSLPMSVVLKNRTRLLPEMNGSTTHSRANPWLTVQV